MRILLSVLSVVLFGAVAVTASGSPPESPPSPSPSPSYTPVPAALREPPDVPVREPRRARRVPGMFALPIEGAEVPSDLELLPGASRGYRAGVHEGIDFPAPAGTPVLAAAAGTVIRTDASFVDWPDEEQDGALSEALALGHTPAATLDRIRGRQVWLDHGRGVVSRYAHLSAVGPFVVGDWIDVGTPIGEVGSSGYPQGGPHLHFEVRLGDGYYGDGLGADELVSAVSRLFRQEGRAPD